MNSSQPKICLSWQAQVPVYFHFPQAVPPPNLRPQIWTIPSFGTELRASLPRPIESSHSYNMLQGIHPLQPPPLPSLRSIKEQSFQGLPLPVVGKSTQDDTAFTQLGREGTLDYPDLVKELDAIKKLEQDFIEKHKQWEEDYCVWQMKNKGKLSIEQIQGYVDQWTVHTERVEEWEKDVSEKKATLEKKLQILYVSNQQDASHSDVDKIYEEDMCLEEDGENSLGYIIVCDQQQDKDNEHVQSEGSHSIYMADGEPLSKRGRYASNEETHSRISPQLVPSRPKIEQEANTCPEFWTTISNREGNIVDHTLDRDIENTRGREREKMQARTGNTGKSDEQTKNNINSIANHKRDRSHCHEISEDREDIERQSEDSVNSQSRNKGKSKMRSSRQSSRKWTENSAGDEITESNHNKTNFQPCEQIKIESDDTDRKIPAGGIHNLLAKYKAFLGKEVKKQCSKTGKNPIKELKRLHDRHFDFISDQVKEYFMSDTGMDDQYKEFERLFMGVADDIVAEMDNFHRKSGDSNTNKVEINSITKTGLLETLQDENSADSDKILGWTNSIERNKSHFLNETRRESGGQMDRTLDNRSSNSNIIDETMSCVSRDYERQPHSATSGGFDISLMHPDVAQAKEKSLPLPLKNFELCGSVGLVAKQVKMNDPRVDFLKAFHLLQKMVLKPVHQKPECGRHIPKQWLETLPFSMAQEQTPTSSQRLSDIGNLPTDGPDPKSSNIIDVIETLVSIVDPEKKSHSASKEEREIVLFEDKVFHRSPHAESQSKPQGCESPAQSLCFSSPEDCVKHKHNLLSINTQYPVLCENIGTLEVMTWKDPTEVLLPDAYKISDESAMDKTNKTKALKLKTSLIPSLMDIDLTASSMKNVSASNEICTSEPNKSGSIVSSKTSPFAPLQSKTRLSPAKGIRLRVPTFSAPISKTKCSIAGCMYNGRGLLQHALVKHLPSAYNGRDSTLPHWRKKELLRVVEYLCYLCVRRDSWKLVEKHMMTFLQKIKLVNIRVTARMKVICKQISDLASTPEPSSYSLDPVNSIILLSHWRVALHVVSQLGAEEQQKFIGWKRDFPSPMRGKLGIFKKSSVSGPLGSVSNSGTRSLVANETLCFASNQVRMFSSSDTKSSVLSWKIFTASIEKKPSVPSETRPSAPNFNETNLFEPSDSKSAATSCFAPSEGKSCTPREEKSYTPSDSKSSETGSSVQSESKSSVSGDSKPFVTESPAPSNSKTSVRGSFASNNSESCAPNDSQASVRGSPAFVPSSRKSYVGGSSASNNSESCAPSDSQTSVRGSSASTPSDSKSFALCDGRSYTTKSSAPSDCQSSVQYDCHSLEGGSPASTPSDCQSSEGGPPASAPSDSNRKFFTTGPPEPGDSQSSASSDSQSSVKGSSAPNNSESYGPSECQSSVRLRGLPASASSNSKPFALSDSWSFTTESSAPSGIQSSVRECPASAPSDCKSSAPSNSKCFTTGSSAPSDPQSSAPNDCKSFAPSDSKCFTTGSSAPSDPLHQPTPSDCKSFAPSDSKCFTTGSFAPSDFKSFAPSDSKCFTTGSSAPSDPQSSAPSDCKSFALNDSKCFTKGSSSQSDSESTATFDIKSSAQFIRHDTPSLTKCYVALCFYDGPDLLNHAQCEHLPNAFKVSNPYRMQQSKKVELFRAVEYLCSLCVGHGPVHLVYKRMMIFLHGIKLVSVKMTLAMQAVCKQLAELASMSEPYTYSLNPVNSILLLSDWRVALYIISQLGEQEQHNFAKWKSNLSEESNGQAGIVFRDLSYVPARLPVDTRCSEFEVTRFSTPITNVDAPSEIKCSITGCLYNGKDLRSHALSKHLPSALIMKKKGTTTLSTSVKEQVLKAVECLCFLCVGYDPWYIVSYRMMTFLRKIKLVNMSVTPEIQIICEQLAPIANTSEPSTYTLNPINSILLLSNWRVALYVVSHLRVQAQQKFSKWKRSFSARSVGLGDILKTRQEVFTTKLINETKATKLINKTKKGRKRKRC